MRKPKEIDYDFKFDYKKLWGLDIGVEKMLISDLESNLDIAYLEIQGTDDWNLTLRQLIANPEAEPDHFDKIKKAEMKYPIEIYFFEGSWKILDGVHRFCKAILAGDETIMIRRVTDQMISKIIKD